MSGRAAEIMTLKCEIWPPTRIAESAKLRFAGRVGILEAAARFCQVSPRARLGTDENENGHEEGEEEEEEAKVNNNKLSPAGTGQGDTCELGLQAEADEEELNSGDARERKLQP